MKQWGQLIAMGIKQTKGNGHSSPEAGVSPQHALGGWKRTPTKERGDIFTSLVLKSGDKFGKGGTPPPYQRRIGMIQEMLSLAKQGKQDEATELLKNLRQEGDSLGAMEKVCRQLTYHLSPHSQWRRQGLMKRKPQACLKAIFSSSPSNNTVDLSGIPLTVKDMDRLILYLNQNSERVTNVELCFTELTDDAFLQLLPTLSTLPLLNTLSLNGNRLTKVILRDLTDTLKDPEKFPSVTWIDLGNNVDIFSLPQPFLVSLRKRCPKQGNLPTILEFGESQVSDLESHDGNLSESLEDLVSEEDDPRESTFSSFPVHTLVETNPVKPINIEMPEQLNAVNQT
ncbi:leucine-rich repeat-containing protein 75A isoform X2 [Polypterus senegalus]|uniref:leucine-rich repeat-containing protein 75A isoform X2 n=1 Tax=Polypterus senegalus TaxID=55291 RepID=UPI0019640635|nr:leucine-rich repeat-containing protein 75A isoform X2 [Polypterus senegalus]